MEDQKCKLQFKLTSGAWTLASGPPSHMACCLNFAIYVETVARGIPRKLTDAKIGHNSAGNCNLSKKAAHGLWRPGHPDHMSRYLKWQIYLDTPVHGSPRMLPEADRAKIGKSEMITAIQDKELAQELWPPAPSPTCQVV